MKVTAIALALLGVAVGAYAGIGYALTDPEVRTTPVFLIVAAAGSVLAGVALLFGGRGYVVSGNPSVHN
jgi:hypothetical protein